MIVKFPWHSKYFGWVKAHLFFEKVNDKTIYKPKYKQFSHHRIGVHFVNKNHQIINWWFGLGGIHLPI